MATSLLAVGTSELASGDITVAAGTPVCVCMKGTASFGEAKILVQVKGDVGGEYYTVGEVGPTGTVLHAPGTYRLFRLNTGQSVGAFSA